MNCPHCDTSVDEHEAGRCLDAWVEKRVVGNDVAQWTFRKVEDWYIDNAATIRTVPYYSTDIAAAWEVVGRVNDGGYIVEIVNDMVAWSVTFIHVDELEKKYTSDWKVSLPTQICRAALKAVGE